MLICAILVIMPAATPTQHSIEALKQAAIERVVAAVVHCQITRVEARLTKGGKPYLELHLADAADNMLLRVWSDHPDYAALSSLGQGAFIAVTGEFSQNEYGLDAKGWSFTELAEAEIEAVLAGDDELRQRQQQDYEDIVKFVAEITDPRLRATSELFLERHGQRLRRTAAARGFHHARRGGLVEHVAQMMRCARAICEVYQKLNRDLLLAGCLFHDCGKLFENCMQEKGFEMPFTKMGELLGHIPSGIELTNSLFLEACEKIEDRENWQPSSSDCRMHLLHLIAAHHGEYEFGSPTLPRTPEAIALHHIDNLDAKHEMMTRGIVTSPLLAPGIHERVRPLPGALVEPLQEFKES